MHDEYIIPTKCVLPQIETMTSELSIQTPYFICEEVHFYNVSISETTPLFCSVLIFFLQFHSTLEAPLISRVAALPSSPSRCCGESTYRKHPTPCLRERVRHQPCAQCYAGEMNDRVGWSSAQSHALRGECCLLAFTVDSDIIGHASLTRWHFA